MPPKNMYSQSPPGVVQNNKGLLFIIGFILAALFLFLSYRTQVNQGAAPTSNNQSKPNVNTSLGTQEIPNWMAKSLEENSKNISVFNKPKTSQEIEKQTVETKQLEFKKAISDDENATVLEIQQIDDKNKIEEKKLELTAQEAPLTISVPPPPSAATAAQAPSSNSINDEVDKLRAAADSIRNKTNDPVKIISDINNQDEKLDFLKPTTPESDYLKNGLETPKSPYEIKAGTFIPAALVVGINTDMPGSVVGQVRENVYYTVTGNYILIPQGTKVVGSYDSKITYGQSRALVVWDRLIFPDGSSINLERMQGTDITGMAGMHDKLNNHYFKLYSNALLLSFVGAGYDILNNQQNQNNQYNAQQAVAANVGQELSNVASKSIEKNMDVQPTITISPGYKFNIFVMKDMILKEVKDVEGTPAISE